MRFDFRNFAAVDAGSSLFPRDRSVSPTMAPHSMASPSRVMILGVRRLRGPVPELHRTSPRD